MLGSTSTPAIGLAQSAIRSAAGCSASAWNMPTPNASVKLEYNYMDFGDDTRTRLSCGGGCRFNETIDRRTHLVMLGWNYRFPIR